MPPMHPQWQEGFNQHVTSKSNQALWTAFHQLGGIQMLPEVFQFFLE